MALLHLVNLRMFFNTQELFLRDSHDAMLCFMLLPSFLMGSHGHLRVWQSVYCFPRSLEMTQHNTLSRGPVIERAD